MPKNIRCAVPSCVVNNNILKTFGVNLRYFSFPKDENQKKEWLFKCNKDLKDLTIHDAVCSRHFQIDDYEDGVESSVINVKPKKLKSNAVPSLFLEDRPEKHRLLKKSSQEYHKLLAQEIMNEEEASKSNDLPIYLEFSNCSDLKTDIGSDNLLDYRNDLKDPLADTSVVDLGLVKKKLNVKPLIANKEVKAVKPERGRSKMVQKSFIGSCYVCDKKIQQCDQWQVSREDFAKTIQKVLEGISTEYVIVMSEQDGLCSSCRSLIDRITKLESELRTVSLGLRALLRLKYSLPPPVLDSKIENPKVQVKFQQVSDTTPAGATSATPKANEKQALSVFKRHKQTQTTLQSVIRHKKTQTDENSFEEVHVSERTFFSPANEVESLETGNLQGNDSVKPILEMEIVSSIQELEQLEANNEQEGDAVEPLSEMEIVSSINEDEHIETEIVRENDSVMVQENTVQFSAQGRESVKYLFEDITNATEMGLLLDVDCVVEESEVITTDRPEEDTSTLHVEQRMKEKPVRSNKNFRMLKCAKCRYKTTSLEEMKSHILSFINKEGFYCSICDFAYHLSNLYTKHKSFHSQISKNKQCIFCDAVVHDELQMRFHIEATHKPNAFHHICSICNKVFMFGNSLRRHIRLKHKIRNEYKCDKCGKDFSDVVKYNHHVEYYHRTSLNCKHCQKQFFNFDKLISHENTIHRFDRTKYYKCRYCPKKFVRQDLLPKHEEHHAGQFKLRCKDCGLGFHEEESLKKHGTACKIMMSKTLSWQATRFRSEFSSHKSLVCDVCGKVVKTRQKYKLHREMHDNPSTFICHVCGKEFRHRCNMNVHIKNMHADVDDIQ